MKNINHNSTGFSDLPLIDTSVISTDSEGNILSFYKDHTWDLSYWAGRRMILNFCDGPRRRGDPVVDSGNGDLLRKIAAFWIFGPRALYKPSSVLVYISIIRPIAELCSENHILLSEVASFPLLIDKMVDVIAKSKFVDAIMIFHQIYESREKLGFYILAPSDIKKISFNSLAHCRKQTPYIPPRIWSYQLQRISKFLQEFCECKSVIEDCFNFLSNGVLDGSIDNSDFADVARKFGIYTFISRWWVKPINGDFTLINFSGFLTAATRIALAYIANVSLMRVSEIWSLRTDCFSSLEDRKIGKVFILTGVTSKTVEDSDGKWIVPESTKLAIETASCISRLRTGCLGNMKTEKIPNVRSTKLFVMAYEPWIERYRSSTSNSTHHQYPSYQRLISEAPKIFSLDELKITDSDFNICQMICTDLDRSQFSPGRVWRLSWHQLRRTGAVNMQASGLVSNKSIQYQLKHATSAMTLYYVHGYSAVRLNNVAAALYVEAMYDMLALDISKLFDSNFVSPYGEDRKQYILRPIASSEHNRLVQAGKSGEIAWRETLLGGCAKRGPCEFGGIDTIVRCGGGDGGGPCADALFDKSRETQILKLEALIEERLSTAEDGSPYQQSLKAQKKSIEVAISFIRGMS